MPTEELWDKLQKILKFDIPYSKICQTFNAQMGVTDVWDDIKFYGEKHRFHPTQKPLDLITRLVLASSNEGDIVLDPFMGSGTTAVACINTNRNYIGFELDKHYCEIANERIRNALAELDKEGDE